MEEDGMPTGRLRWRHRRGTFQRIGPVLEQEVDVVTQDANGYAVHNLSWRPVPASLESD